MFSQKETFLNNNNNNNGSTVLCIFAVPGVVLSPASSQPIEDEETEVEQGQVTCPTSLSW